MARIRTIKPQFFTSEDIVGLSPLARLLFIATWIEADRDGRLVWKPKTLKLRYLPGDACDIEALATELVDAGLVVPYLVGCEHYAEIPTFTRHQIINNRESASTIPPRVGCASGTREARDDNALGTPLEQVQGEGKGREGNNTCAAEPHDEDPPGFLDCWKAYPRREGGNPRKPAAKAYKARVRQGVPTAELLAGTERYAAYVRAKGQEGTAYVKQAVTFYGPDEHWREPWTITDQSGAEASNPCAGAI